MSEDGGGGDLQRQLARLTERLDRIERRLGIEPQAPAAHVQSPESAPITGQPTPQSSAKGQAFGRLFQPEQPATAPSPPPLPPSIPAPVIVPTPPALDDLVDLDSPVDLELAARNLGAPLPSPPVVAPTAHSHAPRASKPSLEAQIGGKWMAWVGAIVVIIAAGFAVKVGFDKGWWGHVGPLWRCLGIAGFGAAMLAAGEIALRRIGRPAAVGLISAGLGTLYLDAYAAARVFELVSIEGAFILMALVALVGFALTVRTQFLAIGVLSILGGYLTPVLLRGQSSHDLPLLLFLTMLLGVSLALAGRMRSSFGTLRFVALACHLAIACAWVAANPAKWSLAMWFMSLWWVMTLAESLLSAIRARAALGNVVMTLIATGAYVTGGCLLLNGSSGASADWMGAFTTIIAVIAAAAVMLFGSGLDALRGRLKRPIDMLSSALWLQCGVLIATAIALQFDGFGEAIGWLTMGLAAIEMGRRLPSGGVSVFGIVIGGLATLRVCTLPAVPDFGGTPDMLRSLFDVVHFEVSRWTILAIINIIALHVAAGRLPRSAPWRTARIVITAIAAVMWLGLCMHQGDGLIVTAAWLAYAAIVLGVRAFEFARGAAYTATALVVLAATAARWLVIDAMAHRLEHTWSADERLPFINWQMALAAAIAGVGWWACRALAQREKERAGEAVFISASPAQSLFWQIVTIAGVAFGLTAICFEIDRGVVRMEANRAADTFSSTHVRQVLFTLAWAMGSVVLAVIARMFMAGGEGPGGITRTWLLRRCAWGLLAACALKWIMLDAPLLFVINRTIFESTLPLFNLQMTVGAALAATILALGLIIAVPTQTRRTGVVSGHTAHPLLKLPCGLQAWMPVLACAMLLWGLTFEVDRLLERVAPLPNWLGAFPPLHLRALLWTLLWLVGAAVMFGVGRARILPAMFRAGTALAALAGIAWLTFDTIAWRIADPPAPVMPILNVQFLVGVACAAALLVMAWSVRALAAGGSAAPLRERVMSPVSPDPFMLAGMLFTIVGATGLWLGSIEIDRIFAGEAESMVRQAGLSVWWAVYAVGLVVLGFARRIALVRYAGLGLLSLTVVKALLIDMSSLDSLPRVLSFAGAGLLLILTSVVYAKLSPVLLRENDEADMAVNGTRTD